MNGYVNRWTLALAWILSMAVVWTLFVPRGLAATTFVLFGIAGLLLVFVGGALVRDSQAPRSVNQILSELEAGPKPAGPTLKM